MLGVGDDVYLRSKSLGKHCVTASDESGFTAAA